MFSCKICGKKFKTMSELGGHTSGAHGKVKTEGAPPDNSEPASVATNIGPVITQEDPPVAPPEEPGVMENIRDLLSRGYSPRQIKEQFGYARRTIDQVAASFIEPEGKSEDANHEPGLPVTVKGSEIITPESIMQRLANGSQDWHLRLEGMMLLRAAQKMNRDDIEMVRMQAEADAKLIEPILRLMKETREEQDAAAARAKASSEEIADRAAHGTAARLYDAISQNNTQVNGSLEQIRQTLSGKNDDPFSRLTNMMQSMQQLSQMFGMPMPGMMPGAPPAGSPGAPPPTASQPIERHKINELEGKNV